MSIFDPDIFDCSYELFFILKTTVEENPSKNSLNVKSNLKEKISEEEIINIELKQKMFNEFDELKENNVSKVKTQLIHPDLQSDNEEEQIKLIVPANTNTDEISKFKNEIAELKNYLAGLQYFVPKVVLGIFNDYRFIKKPNPNGNIYFQIIKPNLLLSEIIEFPINVKEIAIPISQDPNNKLHYDYINLGRLEQFYNLENLIIPSCVFFKEKKFNVSSNSKIINQHYGNLALENLASDYMYREFCNVSDVNLPKLKQLELIGYPKKGVFLFPSTSIRKNYN